MNCLVRFRHGTHLDSFAIYVVLPQNSDLAGDKLSVVEVCKLRVVNPHNAVPHVFHDQNMKPRRHPSHTC